MKPFMVTREPGPFGLAVLVPLTCDSFEPLTVDSRNPLRAVFNEPYSMTPFLPTVPSGLLLPEEMEPFLTSPWEPLPLTVAPLTVTLQVDWLLPSPLTRDTRSELLPDRSELEFLENRNVFKIKTNKTISTKLYKEKRKTCSRSDRQIRKLVWSNGRMEGRWWLYLETKFPIT